MTIAPSDVSLDAGPFEGDDLERRRRRLADARSGVAPSADAEHWRYSPIDDLDLAGFTPALEPGPAPDHATDRPVSARVTIVDGWVVSIDREATAPAGLTITTEIVEADLPDAEQIDAIHGSLSPHALVVRVAAGSVVEDPVAIVSHHSGGDRAAFPHVVVEAGSDAEVSVVEVQSGDGDGLVAPLVDLRVADAARLRYVTVQSLGRGMWQLARQTATVGAQGSLFSGIAAFGGAYARVRTDFRLTGRGASGDLVAVYYADEDQIHDFRTFQHHDAPDTQSDLLFKGAVDDRAGSIYTGLIHIHPEGRGSNAHQTNRNIKLGDDAWAWSTPNLEIENNEVRCSHASTVSPLEVDQQFYLAARGVPPTVADRLIVAGFFREVLDRFRDPLVRSEIERQVAEKLDHRNESGEGDE